MPITTVDKLKINKYIKENKVGEIYYNEMCEAIGKKEKISDIEFLEYFTDCVLIEFRKDTKISAKHVCKLVATVDTFLGWISEENLSVRDETLDKIRSFKEFYQEYLDRTNYAMDGELNDKYIQNLLYTVDNLFPESEKSESLTKYINQITELEKQIKILEKELLDVQKKFESSQKTITQKQEKIESLGSNLMQATNEANNKKSEIESLQKQIRELSSKISELGKELQLKSIELEKISNSNIKLNSELLKFKEEVEILTIELKQLRKIVKDVEKIKKQEEKLIAKENKLESLIYEQLLFNNRSIEEIINIAESSGITTNVSQVLELLKRMKSQINIGNGGFSLSPTYKILTPQVDENGEFSINLPYSTKYYDIMLVSDLHITNFDTKTISLFEHLNEYCTKNGINLILNLGDFFEGFGNKTPKYENAIKNYQLIEQGIKLIPRTEGLYHAILGGNHDYNITIYGFDPIKLLTNDRDDLISLGYSHSVISLNNPEKSLGEFDIHHPNNFTFPLNLSEEGLDTEKIENYLKEIYSKNNRNRDNSYIDIFGHTHKSQLNYLNSYCLVPAFLKTSSKTNAIHLRIYFEQDKAIKYMVFMPLNHNTKLVKNNEIVYQKQLIKEKE